MSRVFLLKTRGHLGWPETQPWPLAETHSHSLHSRNCHGQGAEWAPLKEDPTHCSRPLPLQPPMEPHGSALTCPREGGRGFSHHPFMPTFCDSQLNMHWG